MQPRYKWSTARSAPDAAVVALLVAGDAGRALPRLPRGGPVAVRSRERKRGLSMDERTYLIGIAEKVDALGRDCADSMTVVLTSGQTVTYTDGLTWINFPDGRRRTSTP